MHEALFTTKSTIPSQEEGDSALGVESWPTTQTLESAVKIVRVATAATLGASVLLASHAGAAVKVKPVCNLITDPAGDAFLINVNGSDL